MSKIEARPVTRKWIVCNTCGNSDHADRFKNAYGDPRKHEKFDLICVVCGKEGCEDGDKGCLTWYTDENNRYHYHKTCILTGEFLEGKEKCDEGWKRYWKEKDAHDREYPRDHIV